MTRRSLTPEELERINKIANKTQLSKVEFWPPSKEKPHILAALENLEPVVLVSNKLFRIKECDNDLFFLYLDNGEFAPCGYFSLDSLRKEVSALDVK